MYQSIIATDMLTLRGSHEFERMDEIQLADLGIDRWGNVFLDNGKVVHEIPKLEALTLLSRIVKILAPEHPHSARV